MALVSLILPVLDERENLGELVAEIHAACAGIDYEIIAVDDGSSDGSLDELRRLAADRRVRVVALRRHVGQSAALAAGVDHARGEVVVTLDADGQNDPADAPTLVEALCTDPNLAAVVGCQCECGGSLARLNPVCHGLAIPVLRACFSVETVLRRTARRQGGRAWDIGRRATLARS